MVDTLIPTKDMKTKVPGKKLTTGEVHKMVFNGYRIPFLNGWQCTKCSKISDDKFTYCKCGWRGTIL